MIKKIEVPTLLMVGKHDKIIKANPTLKAYNKRFKKNKNLLSTYVFQNSGHLPFEEEYSLFTKILKNKVGI
jgi:triacylglycerol lipase